MHSSGEMGSQLWQSIGKSTSDPSVCLQPEILVDLHACKFNCLVGHTLDGWSSDLQAGCENDTNVGHLLPPILGILLTKSFVVFWDRVGG